MLKKLIVIITLFLVLANLSYAFTIPQHDNYVTDVAKVLSAEEEQTLENQIYTIRQQTSNEIVVLIIPSTEGEDIAMLANEVGNTWGVGSKEFDNGIVILIAIDDRSRFTAIGYGLEGTLPDAIVKRIGENRFPENFRQAQYFQGITTALNDMQGYLLNDPTIKEYYQQSQNTVPYGSENTEKEYSGILFVVGIVLAGSFFTKKRKFRKNALLFLGLGGALGGIGGRVLGDFLFILALGYMYLFIGILMIRFKFLGIFLGGRGGGGGGSSFGGFGGGSFGGGGSGGKR